MRVCEGGGRDSNITTHYGEKGKKGREKNPFEKFPAHLLFEPGVPFLSLGVTKRISTTVADCKL